MGCDINPVATLIARTKSGAFRAKRLDEYFAAIESKVTKASDKVQLQPVAIERLAYWYSADQFRDLAKLLNAESYMVANASTEIGPA